MPPVISVFTTKPPLPLPFPFPLPFGREKCDALLSSIDCVKECGGGVEGRALEGETGFRPEDNCLVLIASGETVAEPDIPLNMPLDGVAADAAADVAADGVAAEMMGRGESSSI